MGAKKVKPVARPTSKSAAKPGAKSTSKQAAKPVVKPVARKSQGKQIILQDTYLEQVKLWADKHYPLLVGISAAILFAIISAWGIRTYDAHLENTARAAYSVVISKLPEEGKARPEDWQKLVPELQKFIADHKGTQPALMARMELARAYFETKRYDEAIKAGIDAMKYLPPGHDLRPLLQYQLACTYEAAGNHEQAAKEWAQLKESGASGFQREAEWNLGRNFAEKKDFAKAVESYQKAAEIPGAYPSQPMLDQELTRARQAAGIAEKPAAGAGDKAAADKPAPGTVEKAAADKTAPGPVVTTDKPAVDKPAPGSAEKAASDKATPAPAGKSPADKPAPGSAEKAAADKTAPGPAGKSPAGAADKPAPGVPAKK